jgi:hypothetical protein
MKAGNAFVQLHGCSQVSKQEFVLDMTGMWGMRKVVNLLKQ